MQRRERDAGLHTTEAVEGVADLGTSREEHDDLVLGMASEESEQSVQLILNLADDIVLLQLLRRHLLVFVMH